MFTPEVPRGTGFWAISAITDRYPSVVINQFSTGPRVVDLARQDLRHPHLDMSSSHNRSVMKVHRSYLGHHKGETPM